MRGPLLVLVLLLPGCDGCTPDESVPERVEVISESATGLWVGSGSGVGSVTVPAFATNAVGAAVVSGEIAFVSTGELAASAASPDAFGWAFAEVTAPSAGAWSVDGSGGAGTGGGTAFITTMPDVRLAFPAWLTSGSGSPLAPAGAGLVVARDNELWWSAIAGGAPARVAVLSGPVVGLKPVHIDTDGVGDLVAWSSEEAVLLRGRGAGGLSFLAGWRTISGPVIDAVVQPLDDNSSVDAVLLLGDANSSTLVWIPNDGDGAFAPAAVLDTDFGSYGITAEDANEDGTAEVSMLTGDGVLRRFQLQEDGWQAASKADASLGLAEESHMLGNFDGDGDLISDVLVWGPGVDGEGYLAQLVTRLNEVELIYGLTSSIQPLTSLALDVADADGDGLVDIFMSSERRLYRAEYSRSGGTFVLDTLTGVPDAERIAVTDVSGDGFPDVILSGASAVALVGTSVADNPDTEDDETISWKIATPWTGLFDVELGADPWLGDFNADGIVDVVSFVQPDSPALQAFYGTAAEGSTKETLRAARSFALELTDVPLDLAVCGSDLWALYESTEGTVAHHLAMDGFGGLTEVGTTVVIGTMIACGDFGSNVAVVTDGAGEYTWISESGVARGETGEPAGDLAGIDVDGDGVDDLVTCAGACTVAVGDFDGDGLGDSAWSDGAETTVVIAGVESTLGFGGAVSAGDADGDGVVDILVQDEGVLAAWRGLGGRPGVPFLNGIARDTRGRGFVGDLDGNGIPDAFWLGDETDTTDSVDWTGTLLYAAAPDAASE
jgi:hypothetical protein